MHQRLLSSTWSTPLCILGSFRALWPSDTTCKVLHSKSILSKVNFASVPEISIKYPSPLNNYKLLYKYLTAQYKSILRYFLPEILNGFSKNADAYDWLTFGRSKSQVKTVIPLFLWSLPLTLFRTHTHNLYYCRLHYSRMHTRLLQLHSGTSIILEKSPTLVAWGVGFTTVLQISSSGIIYALQL